MIAILFSCTNEVDDHMTLAEAKKDISLAKDGVLEFSTMKVYKETIDWLNSASDEEISQWNNELGFESLHAQYLKASLEIEQMEQDFAEVIQAISEVESEDQKNNFESKYSEEMRNLLITNEEIKKRYDNYLYFSNNHVERIKTYDSKLAGLLNKEGYVYVQGSRLQYTEDELQVIPNYSIEQRYPEVYQTKGKQPFRYNLSGDNDGKNTYNKYFRDNCYAGFGPNSKVTGNTAVINTMAPRYRQVWVPEYCEIIDDRGKEICVPGHYENVLDGYDVEKTRLEAIIRNYKLVCFLGCFEIWEERSSIIKVSGIHNQTIDVGIVEKYNWNKTISPTRRGTLTVEYISEKAFLNQGQCPTQVSWSL